MKYNTSSSDQQRGQKKVENKSPERIKMREKSIDHVNYMERKSTVKTAAEWSTKWITTVQKIGQI